MACNHHWKPKISNILYNNTGCPKCAKSGFDPSKNGTFYIFLLEKDGRKGLGFGITNVLAEREKDHKRTFRETNTIGTLIRSFKFKTGYHAQEIEAEIKKHPAIIDFGITGFRRECLPVSLKKYLFNRLSDYKARSEAEAIPLIVFPIACCFALYKEVTP